MNNRQKRKFILDGNLLYIKHQPYTEPVSFEEMRRKEDALWNEYRPMILSSLPGSLYKYRRPSPEAIDDFINDTAWFSHPIDFDDTMDSSLNNDIETELRNLELNPINAILNMSLALLNNTATASEQKVVASDVQDILPYFNNDGSPKVLKLRSFLHGKMPENEINECINRLKDNAIPTIRNNILSALQKTLEMFLSLNTILKTKPFVFCLAEESDNQAMWGLYAEESKGFCIEYSFSDKTLLGQRILTNLFPIHYGKKPIINFYDFITNALNPKLKKVGNVALCDYQKMIISTYTKDKTYAFQKEWRIIFDDHIGQTQQIFPFVKSITLGERMSKETANKLIDAARKKGIKIYQRCLNVSKSGLIIKEI